MSGMGAGVNRVASVAMISGVLAGTCALGYGVARATGGSGPATRRCARWSSTAPVGRPRAADAPPRRPTRAADARSPRRLTRAGRRQVPRPARLLGAGDHGPKVRDLQSRLRQIAWYFGNVTDDYGHARPPRP